MLTQLYRSLLEASLDFDGVLEPSVSADGQFSDESGGDLLKAEDGLTLICQALIRADAAMRREIAVEIKRERAQEVATELNDERLDIGSTYEALARRVERLISKAEQEGNDGLALASMEGLRKILHDMAAMSGKLAQQLTVQVSLIESKEWIELRLILESIFRDHPAAGRMFLDLARRRRDVLAWNRGFAAFADAGTFQALQSE